MGRGKIEIKRIENSSNRHVTYSKRRNGIIKKAKEISVLCDAEVSLVIFASSGKMHEFCTPTTTLTKILERYHKQSGKRLWDAKHENLSNELDRIKKENDTMQIQLRHLRGEDITSLNIQELIDLEDALETGLTSIRDQQSELAKMVRRNVKLAEDENRELVSCISRKMTIDGDGKGLENNGYPQAPFAFRVQPMQPNLQDRM